MTINTVLYLPMIAPSLVNEEKFFINSINFQRQLKVFRGVDKPIYVRYFAIQCRIN